MDQLRDIDTALFENQEIIKKKKSPVLFVGIMLAGVIGAIGSGYAGRNEDLAFGLLFVGICFILIGLIGTLIPKRYLYHRTLEEKLVREQLYYQLSDKETLMAFFRNKDIDGLLAMPESEGNALMVILYSTPSSRFRMAQIQEYIPHQYVPLMEPVDLSKS